jgi:hypothetical protein
MLILNSIICCICVWGIAKVYNRFIRRAKINSYRFKLFELRDKLSILVLQKKVTITDKEYLTLLTLLNTSIRVFDENFSFAGFFGYLARLASNTSLSRDIDDMIKHIKTHKNPELVLIASDYFELNYLVFNKYTRRTPLSIVIKLLYFTASLLVKLSEFKKKNHAHVVPFPSNINPLRKRFELEEEINASLGNSLEQLRAA